MKVKFLTVITSLLAAAFMITSCLDDNNVEIEYSSNASITGFSINNIETQYVDSEHYGKDTTLTVTLTGSQYPFAIDQSQRLIYNVDSLPVGTDVSKVVVNITADTSWILTTDGEKDSIWTSTDSLNFEKPIKFKVVAYSGAVGPVYTAQINVHKLVPDSLQWSDLGNGLPTGIAAQKAVATDERIYVFTQQETGVEVTSTAVTDGRNWTALTTTNLPEGADYTSVMQWNQTFYMLADHDLYTSDNAQDWQKLTTNTQFTQLIANVSSDHNRKLYAIDTENQFVESTDGLAWERNGEVPADFPRKSLSACVLPLNTNQQIDRIAVAGDSGIATDTTTVVWTRLTTEHNWADYRAEENATNYCPRLENLSLIYYADQLYAFGGPGKAYGKENEAFNRFYTSRDQGITWAPVQRYLAFPDTFTELYERADGQYSYVLDKNNFLWILWSNSGQVWRGRINKLGFAQ